MTIVLSQFGKGDSNVKLNATSEGYSIITTFQTWVFAQDDSGFRHALSLFDSLRAPYMLTYFREVVG
jgi:hypothetical protein